MKKKTYFDEIMNQKIQNIYENFKNDSSAKDYYE